MPTIVDVARRSGVSRTTVSRVLNNHDPVNEKTRNRVLRAIRELKYQPSIFAQGMRFQRTNSFAVLIPDFTTIYYSELLHYVEMEARRRGYLVLACTTEVDPSREKEYVGELLRRHVDGLMFCWYRDVKKEKGYLKGIAGKVPVVLLDQPAEDLPITSVYTDGFSGVKEATTYLINRGHRRFAYIRSLYFSPAVKERYRGFLSALNDHGIEFNHSLLGTSDLTIQGGYRAAEALLEKGNPTAVVADDDQAAIGALEFFRETGKKVPREIALTGFDNIMISAHISPSLTTVAQPIREIAEAATGALIDSIEGKTPEKREIVFPAKLIVRESSG